MQSRQGDDPGGLAGDGERSVPVVEQEDGEVNATRRTVAGHTGDTVDEPSKGRASGSMAVWHTYARIR